MKKIDATDYTGKCPLCGKDPDEVGTVDAEGEKIWVEFSCKRCGAKWYEVYKISYIVVEEESDEGCM